MMIVGSKKRMWLLSILRILEWSFWYMGIRFFWFAIPGMEKLTCKPRARVVETLKCSIIPRLKYILGMRSILMQVGKS